MIQTAMDESLKHFKEDGMKLEDIRKLDKIIIEILDKNKKWTL